MFLVNFQLSVTNLILSGLPSIILLSLSLLTEITSATNLTVGSLVITNSAPIDTRAVRVTSVSIDNVFESDGTTQKSLTDNKYYVKENEVIHINVNLSRGVTFNPPTGSPTPNDLPSLKLSIGFLHFPS